MSRTRTIPPAIADLVEKQLRVWGSECLACSNATPDSMFCDNCGTASHTTALYVRGDVYEQEDQQ